MNDRIKKIHSVREWQGKDGVMFSADIELESGKSGQVNMKTPDRWKEGDEVTITREVPSKYGLKMSLSKADYQTGGTTPTPYSGRKDDVQHKIDGSWAISQAIQLALCNSEKLDNDKLFEWAKTILKMRNKIVELNTKEDAESTQK